MLAHTGVYVALLVGSLLLNDATLLWLWLVPLLAGLDKFFNILADWPAYVSPAVSSLLPMSDQSFMYLVGIIEIAVGVMVLTKWTRLGAWVAMVWLALIAGNLILLGSFDIAVRDLAMAVGAYTLARLAEARAASPARTSTKTAYA